jgi:hypothetical protein
LRFLFIRLLKLSGRPDSKDLMREGAEVSGIFVPSVEDPKYLVLYMHLRMFAYLSNILINASFDPIASILASGTERI